MNELNDTQLGESAEQVIEKRAGVVKLADVDPTPVMHNAKYRDYPDADFSPSQTFNDVTLTVIGNDSREIAESLWPDVHFYEKQKEAIRAAMNDKNDTLWKSVWVPIDKEVMQKFRELYKIVAESEAAAAKEWGPDQPTIIESAP